LPSLPVVFPERIECFNLPYRSSTCARPLGIGTDRPRLSWQTATDARNWQQAAFAIECFAARTVELRDYTGRVESGQSVLVNWACAPLHSRERVSLRVRVWGADGSESVWSEPVRVEAGLLQTADWRAQFVSPAWDGGYGASESCPLFARGNLTCDPA
jgi:alpha-L-rhamnosidase